MSHHGCLWSRAEQKFRRWVCHFGIEYPIIFHPIALKQEVHFVSIQLLWKIMIKMSGITSYEIFQHFTKGLLELQTNFSCIFPFFKERRKLLGPSISHHCYSLKNDVLSVIEEYTFIYYSKITVNKLCIRHFFSKLNVIIEFTPARNCFET